MTSDTGRGHADVRRHGPFRGSSVLGDWTNSVRENFFECASNDPEVHQIWCYTDRLSYAPGDKVRFHVSTSAPFFDLEIVRDGHVPATVLNRTGLAGRHHETPCDSSVHGCGWPPAFEVEVPADWSSAGYVVTTRAEAADGTAAVHHHIFFVRPHGTGRRGRVLLLSTTSTWLAYNEWGGSNHYEGINGPGGNEYAPVVSTERPWSRGFVVLPKGAPRIALTEPPPMGAAIRYPHMEWAFANGYSKKYCSAGWASYDRNFVTWAQAQGLEVDSISQHDLHFRPELLEGYACVVIVGHDEYWSAAMRDHIEAYIEAGGRVARFAGNFIWQVRLENDGLSQVCYKLRAETDDPVRDTAERHLLTTLWESRAVNRPGALTFGLNGSCGVYAGWGGCIPRGSGGFTVYRPDHWAFAGADVYYGDQLGAASHAFGYEVDGLAYEIRGGLPYALGTDGAPDDIEIIGLGLATLFEADHGNHGSTFFIGSEDLELVTLGIHGEATPQAMDTRSRGSGMIASFRRGKGEVFNAGSCEWIAGLIRKDPQIEQVTRNVLNRFLTT
jgi:hypothetical protein